MIASTSPDLSGAAFQVNCNNPAIGDAARAVLARNGVATEAVYTRNFPACRSWKRARLPEPVRAALAGDFD